MTLGFSLGALVPARGHHEGGSKYVSKYESALTDSRVQTTCLQFYFSFIADQGISFLESRGHVHPEVSSRGYVFFSLRDFSEKSR